MLLQAIPAPPAPPAPPALPAAQGAPVIVDGNGQVIPLGGDPAQTLRGANARVDMLKDQLEELDERRSQLVQEIRQLREQGVEDKGVEARIASLDIQIQDVEKQLGEARTSAAQAAAVPGAIVEEPHFPRDNGPPEGVFIVASLFVLFVLGPVALAFARRLWKKGMPGPASAALPSKVEDRLKAIEQAVESVAIEVERIGEGQRFMSRVFTERTEGQRQLGEGAAQPVEVAQRERVPERR